MEEGGPSLWKVHPGERLAWVGLRGEAEAPKATLIALIDCRNEGYVYGEPASPTLDSVTAFGAPSTTKVTAEKRRVWSVGYDAAVSLPLTRTRNPD